MADIPHIELLGKRHAVVLPGFTEREELVLAWSKAAPKGGMQLLRASSAYIGLCTRLGRESKADYAATDFNPLAYGGAVYAWLRSQKVEPKDIADIGITLNRHVLADLYPRDEEISEAAGKSGASAEP